MSAQLYDELDPLYREIWGTSLHHGLWESGRESPEQAKAQLIETALKLMEPKGTVADIGCGYGSLSHLLVEEFPCEVHACTHSKKQAEAIPAHPRITPHHCNWLDHGLPPDSLDQAIAIESLSHFSDFDNFAQTTATALQPGGSLVIADWFGSGQPSRLLGHLAHAGEIPPWRPPSEFISAAARHGLTTTDSTDLSTRVARTWTSMFKNAALLPLKKPDFIPALLRQSWLRPELLWTFPLLRLAYHRGLLQYHLIRFTKSPELSSRPSS